MRLRGSKGTRTRAGAEARSRALARIAEWAALTPTAGGPGKDDQSDGGVR
jgi:hypothetical protein